MNKIFKQTAFATLFTGLIGLHGTAHAQVWVNGQLVQGQQLALLQMGYGEAIPAGRYWLDAGGNWGYEGNRQVMGNLYSDNYGSASNSSRGGIDYYGTTSYGGGATARDPASGCRYFSTGGMSVKSCPGN